MDNQTQNSTLNNPFTQKDINEKKHIAYEKIAGYLLLFAGLFMIFLSLFLVFRVLTGDFRPPQVSNYRLAPIELSLPTQTLQFPEGTQLPEGSPPPTGLSTTKIQLPDNLVNDFVGISFYYLLMLFLASAGTKISGIGIKMIKDIKIKV